MTAVLVAFGGKIYDVTLSVGGDHKVKVVGGQTLQPGTNNWLRAVRMALRIRSKP